MRTLACLFPHTNTHALWETASSIFIFLWESHCGFKQNLLHIIWQKISSGTITIREQLGQQFHKYITYYTIEVCGEKKGETED